MRTLAALAVVWNHVWNMIAGPMTPGAPWFIHLVYITAGFGQDAVLVFFVISGYWIARSTLSKIRENRWHWRGYAIDRLARLWIVVVPAILIGAVLDGIGRYALDLPLYRAMAVIGPSTFDVGTRLDPLHALISLIFLQKAVLPPFGSNLPLWSLAYEFWYYAWFPVLALFAIRRRVQPLAVIGVVLTAVLLFVYLRLFPVWLMGAGIAALVLTKATAPGWAGFAPRAFLGSGLFAFISAEVVVHLFDFGFVLNGLIVGLGFSLFLYSLLASSLTWPKWLGALSRYGAESSFSLYAVHFPVLAMIVALLPRIDSAAIALAAALAVSGLLVAWGYLFSRMTEAHTGALRTWSRKRLGLAPMTKEASA